MNEQQTEAKQKTQEQLSSPLSKFLKSNDLGNFENCELNNEVTQSIFDFHPHLYQMSRNLHKTIFLPQVALCTSGTNRS